MGVYAIHESGYILADVPIKGDLLKDLEVIELMWWVGLATCVVKVLIA